MLIIWLQGIWLPLHGYDYSDTPLWAGIFLLPLTAGFLSRVRSRAPVRPVRLPGHRHRRDGGLRRQLHRPDAAARELPLLGFRAAHRGERDRQRMFAAPNSSSIMGSVPARQRGAASGMRSTFQNSGTALSIGVFFSLMIAGLASRLPVTLTAGLRQRRPARHRASDRHPAAGVVTVRRGPRREPARPPAGRPRRPGPPGRGPADPHRPGVLPGLTARSSTAWSSCSPWPPSCPSSPPWHRPCAAPAPLPPQPLPNLRSRTSSAASRVSSGRTFQTGLVQAELA